MSTKFPSLQTRYNYFLKTLLEEKLYETAVELNIALQKEFGITSQNARKVIERAVNQKAIKSSKPYTFGKGQYAYIFNDYSLDKESVKVICQKSRPPVYRILENMDSNDEIISYFEALKLAAAPVGESSTKVTSLDDIISLLMKLDILYKKKDTNDVVYLIYKLDRKERGEIHEALIMNHHYNKMTIDCSVLPDILRWLQNANIIDNANVLYRNKKTPHMGVTHNHLVWDALAYTKTTGINPVLAAATKSPEEQTLVVLDVVLSGEYLSIHLDAFLSRIQINRNSTKEQKRKTFPIIIYKSCDSHTLNKIRKNGIVTFDIALIFGTKIYSVLDRMAELSALFSGNHPVEETISNILTTIGKAGQDEALKELRGTLFEFMMYPLLKALYPNASIMRGRVLEKHSDEGKKEKYEYDYIIDSSHPPEIICVELKGYQAAATINTGNVETKASVKWFFKKSVPFAAKYFRGKEDKPVKAVFITSANFYEDGHTFLESMDRSKYKPSVLDSGYDRSALVNLLKKYGFNNEVRILKKYYSGREKTDQ